MKNSQNCQGKFSKVAEKILKSLPGNSQFSFEKFSILAVAYISLMVFAELATGHKVEVNRSQSGS